ncbi:radical SAM protein [Nanoarchaeota archaeon]
MKQTWFERAVFLSWYCGTPDCKFCYMSTLKGKVNPKKARRTLASVLAEVFIAKKAGWKIEFITAGTKSFSDDELVNILKMIYSITGEKHLLNFGSLSEEQIKLFSPYIKGYAGTVECINPDVRKEVCPTKPIEPILESFKLADKYNLEKAMTIIIGIGETEEDIPKLIDFINEYKIDKLILYALNPIKGTSFSQGPKKEYYLKWLREIRKEFPELYIVAGPWRSRVDIIHEVLEAGATSITKFPAIKLFNTKISKQIEDECKMAGFKFTGTMTEMPELDFKEIDDLGLDIKLTKQIKEKVTSYFQGMKGNSCKV